MEHQVKQRTPEWFDLRRHVVVTASCIADAVGGGRGKPYDFLLSLFQGIVVHCSLICILYKYEFRHLEAGPKAIKLAKSLEA